MLFKAPALFVLIELMLSSLAFWIACVALADSCLIVSIKL